MTSPSFRSKRGAAGRRLCGCSGGCGGRVCPFTHPGPQAAKRKHHAFLLFPADFPRSDQRSTLVCPDEFVEKKPRQLQNVVNAWFAHPRWDQGPGLKSTAWRSWPNGAGCHRRPKYSEYERRHPRFFSLEEQCARPSSPATNELQSLLRCRSDQRTSSNEVGLAEDPARSHQPVSIPRFVEAVK